MHDTDGVALVVLGCLLLAGYVAHLVAPRFYIPKVTLLLVLGAGVGPSALDIVPDRVVDWFPFVSQMALAMVGFLLGESFAGKHLKETGSTALSISVVKSIGALALVVAGLLAIGAPLPLALLLGGIAPATAPAAVYETARDMRADGPLTRTTLEIVAIDDAWGIILFTLALAAAHGVAGDAEPLTHLGVAIRQIGGAVLIGGGLGLPMAWITSRIRCGEPTLIEAAGFVFLCAGAAGAIGASYLLACMTLGAVMANSAGPRTRPFHAIDRVREPFLAVFFLMAGFKFDWGALLTMGAVGGVYIAARMAGFIAAGWGMSVLLGAPAPVRRSVGPCLLPQAGVALGLALLAEQQIDAARGKILPIIIATTVIFEIIGPVVLRWRLEREGERGRAEADDEAD